MCNGYNGRKAYSLLWPMHGRRKPELSNEELNRAMEGNDSILIKKALNPELHNDDIMPATLSYDIMTTLLRDKLGFDGMVVTDASHMVAMTNRMKRSEMLPLSINGGCDMFLFFNDPEGDFACKGSSGPIYPDRRHLQVLTRLTASVDCLMRGCKRQIKDKL